MSLLSSNSHQSPVTSFQVIGAWVQYKSENRNPATMARGNRRRSCFYVYTTAEAQDPEKSPCVVCLFPRIGNKEGEPAPEMKTLNRVCR
jgi:hypothetical protein